MARWYSLCWNASIYEAAMIVRIPSWILVPVIAPSSLQSFRTKRDFEITAAICLAIGLMAAAGTVAAVTMTYSVQTAQTLNNLSFALAQALDAQAGLDSQLHIDLVQEQVDVL